MSVTRNEGKKTVLQATIQDKTKQIARQMHTSHGFPAHTVRARLELTLYFSTHLCFTSLPVSYVFSIHIYTYALSLFSKRASHLWPK